MEDVALLLFAYSPLAILELDAFCLVMAFDYFYQKSFHEVVLESLQYWQFQSLNLAEGAIRSGS